MRGNYTSSGNTSSQRAAFDRPGVTENNADGYFAARLSLVDDSHNFRRRSAATCVDREASAKLKPERNIAKAVSSADC